MRTQEAIRVGLILALGAGAVGLPACRGDRSDKPPRQFFPDMDDSPKWKAQTQSEFYADGRSMRQPVANTVAWGEKTSESDPERARYLKDDLQFYTGKDARGEVIANMPTSAILAFLPAGATDDQAGRATAVTAMLARGEDRFNIYCSACHGFDGKGQGTVGVRMTIAPGNMHEKRFRDRNTVAGADGHIFDVIRHGWNNGNMPPYAHALTERDSWAIVTYVRALQEVTVGQSQPGDANPPPAIPLGSGSATPATPTKPPTPAAGGTH